MFAVLALLLIAPALAVHRLCAAGGVDVRVGGMVAALISLLAFALVRGDKKRAQQDAWRIPERVLHGVEWLGGWPGSLLAQRLYRHKVSKPSYQVMFWFIVVAYEFVAIDYLRDWGWLRLIATWLQ